MSEPLDDILARLQQIEDMPRATREERLICLRELTEVLLELELAELKAPRHD